MAVHAKNPTFAELQREKVAESVKNSFSTIESESNSQGNSPSAETESSLEANAPSPAPASEQNAATTVTKQKKNVLIGIHVTEGERAELRKTFCANGFSLATAYRAAMTYVRQDLKQGKAYITENGEILRK